MPSPGCSAIGIVRAADANHITVEFAAPPRCKGCGGACLWHRVVPNEPLAIAARGPFRVGAAVTVTLPDRHLLLAAAFVYGVPLLALLIGAAGAAAFSSSDLAAAVGAAAALGGALLVTSRLRRRLELALLRGLAVRAGTEPPA